MSRLRVPVSERDHRRGSLQAPVLLVEYGDYQCPHCAAAQPLVHALLRLLGNDLCLVYRHFPLITVHPYAEQAAEAAEAAGAQGAFWRMHDTLFENQAALDEDSLLDHAEALGLDVVRFGHELLTNQYLPRVREDFMGGVRSGVNGTPAFFVDGERYDGPLDVASLDTALRQSMGEKTR